MSGNKDFVTRKRGFDRAFDVLYHVNCPVSFESVKSSETLGRYEENMSAC